MDLLKRLPGLALALIFAGTVLPGAAGAQTAAQNGTQFRDWTLACRALAINETACVLNQVLVKAEDKTFLAEFGVSLQASDDGPVAVLVMRVPSGVLLLTRPAAEVDGDKEHRIALGWQSCDPQVCAASAILSPEDTARLRRGKQAVVGYQPLGQDTPSVFALSLAGITAGMETLEQALAGKAEK